MVDAHLDSLARLEFLIPESAQTVGEYAVCVEALNCYALEPDSSAYPAQGDAPEQEEAYSTIPEQGDALEHGYCHSTEEVYAGGCPTAKRPRIDWKSYRREFGGSLHSFVEANVMQKPNITPVDLHRMIVELIGDEPGLTKHKVNARKQHVLLKAGRCM